MAATYTDRHGYAPRERANSGVHGNGRRPGRPVYLDLQVLAAWNAANQRAIRANRAASVRIAELDHLEAARRLS